MGNFPISCHPPTEIYLPQSEPSQNEATIIFTGGTILTMVDSYPTAEAVAVRKDKILAVGRKADILKLHEGPNTKIVELPGKQTLMPGLIEPHSHPVCGSFFKFLETISAFSGELNTAAKVEARIKQVCDEKIQAVDPSFWICFYGWDIALVQDLPYLDAKKLDEISTTRNPVFILAQTMHSAWINTKGLEVCGITADTPDPVGGEIVRDENGNPTGMLKEQPAINYPAGRILAQHTPVEKLQNHLDALNEYAKEGFTTVAELGSIPLPVPTLGLLSYLSSLKECPIRMGFYWPGLGGAEKPSSIFANEKLFFPGVKIWADGSPYTGTMATVEDYMDTDLTRALGFDLEAHPNGFLIYEDDEESTGLQKQIADIEKFHDELIATHCHGERAIDQSIDAYEYLIRKYDKKDHRYRFEHLGLVTDQQLKRATNLGITTTFYIDHVYYYGNALRDGIIGKERATRFTPVGLAIQNGQNHVTMHDDSPSSPIHPFRCMMNALHRRLFIEPDTQLGKQYCVRDVNDALKAFTISAAWQLKKEKELGSLEPGKLADLVILSTDPRPILAQNLDVSNIKVIKTYLGGVEQN